MAQKELYHYGIPGMHWGQKNGPPYPLSESKHESVVSKAKRVYGEAKEANRQRKIRNRTIDPKDMTPEELDEQLKRLKKEQEYLNLVGKKSPNDILKEEKQKGEGLVESVLQDVGKVVIVPLAAGLIELKLREHFRNKASGDTQKIMDSLRSKLGNDTEKYDAVLKAMASSEGFGFLGETAKREQAMQAVKTAMGDDSDGFKYVRNLMRGLDPIDGGSTGMRKDDLDTLFKHLKSKWDKK